ncbi:hypothetical protein KCU61_g4772, partial [Aureobasidium melanogenum]
MTVITMAKSMSQYCRKDSGIELDDRYEKTSFLTLPAEIRTQIWNFVFDPAQSYKDAFQCPRCNDNAPSALQEDYWASTYLQPLLTCRQFYQDAHLLAFSRTTFVIRNPYTVLDIAGRINSTLRPAQVSSLRSIAIISEARHFRQMHHWKTHAFGIPALQLENMTIILHRSSYWHYLFDFNVMMTQMLRDFSGAKKICFTATLVKVPSKDAGMDVEEYDEFMAPMMEWLKKSMEVEEKFSSPPSPGGTVQQCRNNGDHSWVRVPRKLSFINQTREVMATYGQGTENEGQQLSEEVLEDDTPDETLSQHQDSTVDTQSIAETNPGATDTTSPNPLVVPSPQTLQTPATFQSPTTQDVDMQNQSYPELQHHLQHHHVTTEQHASPSITEIVQATENEIMQAVEGKNNMTPNIFYEEPTAFTPSGIPIAYASPGVLYTERPIWPLKSAQEAQLMRFFVEKIAPAIDLCDRDRHFALVVPQRASQCPILLNAVFAASARHLSTISDFDPIVSNKYNQECLKHLIPKLSDADAITDENLLAATVILRHLEELEISMSGSDTENHLLGTHLLMSAQEHHRALAGGLRKAVYWFGLRQEIYVSFVKQRPIHDSFKRCTMDVPLNPIDDFDWANSIIARTGEVIQFCFDEREHSTTNYDNIVQHFDAWFMQKPDSYMPIYSVEANSTNVFPELWYLNDAVITGLQHYHLGRALLAVYNPRIPRLGVAHRNALKEVGEVLKDQIKIICGIALSNHSISASYVHASMMIAMGGDRFTERREQEGLFEILTKAQKEYAWPTQSVQEHLKEVWGW